MRLSPEEIARFDRDGYLFFPSLFKPDEIEVLTDEVPRLYAMRRPENPADVLMWQDMIDNHFERPRLEQIQSDTDECEAKTEQRLRQKWLVIIQNAPVNRHGEISDCRLQISD